MTPPPHAPSAPQPPLPSPAGPPSSAASKKGPLRSLRHLLLRVWLWLADLFPPNELRLTLFWAGLIGYLGAMASIAFRDLTTLVHHLFTGHFSMERSSDLVHSFQQMAWWQRLCIPIVGAVLAGLALRFARRIQTGKSTTDYMEAIVLGDGVVSSRVSLVKSLSALFSIASGASIGREGPLVQLSAMIASLLGRVRKMPTVRLRLLVACGAAAGIASAYNAPLGGALFVSEIILRSLSMESFGPLIFSSVVATLTVRHQLGGSPLYEITMPSVELHSNWEMILYVFFGILIGFFAPLLLWLLKQSEQLFKKIPHGQGLLRLSIGGLLMGLMALLSPVACGNGYTIINDLLHHPILWQTLLFFLIIKLAATAAVFGSGAVGGIFTPTLFMGACLGNLFVLACAPFWPGPPLVPAAFIMVGMGALLAATTHAPIMAILVLFEMTLDYQMILPLMVSCVIAYYISFRLQERSIYAESLKRKSEGSFESRLASLRVADLMKPSPPSVREASPFAEITAAFLTNRFINLYVTDNQQAFKGVISLHDIKNYLGDEELANLVIARDLLHPSFPTITPQATLAQALAAFSHLAADRLPVVENLQRQKLVGSISKNDLLLAMAEQNQAETPK